MLVRSLVSILVGDTLTAYFGLPLPVTPVSTSFLWHVTVEYIVTGYYSCMEDAGPKKECCGAISISVGTWQIFGEKDHKPLPVVHNAYFGGRCMCYPALCLAYV